MLKFNKKAFSEIVSFSLITMLIVVSSITAYLFSSDILDDEVISVDLKNMKGNFHNLNYKISEISQFDGASFSINLNFNKGLLSFQDNLVKYVSLSPYIGEEYCGDEICYNSSNDYENVYFTLPGSYVFYENMTLIPGNYVLRFKNIKNGEKIKIYFN